MPPKPSDRPLRELELTGWRRVFRLGVLVVLAITAAVTALAGVLSATEAPLGLLVAPVGIALAVGAARASNRRFPRGLWLGLISTVASSVSLTMMVITMHQGYPVAAWVAIFGSLAIFALGPVLMATEVIVHLSERARLRRDADPVFPEARVIER